MNVRVLFGNRKYNIRNTALLKQTPSLQTSQKQTSFFSKTFNVTVKKQINKRGRHEGGTNVSLKETTDFRNRTT